jgi:hypothetical protein
MPKPSLLRHAASLPGWSRQSFYLLGGYLAVMALIAWFWWPLARDAFVADAGWDGERHWRFDWLLLGNFLAMFLLIMAKADWRADLKIALAGLAGGLAIECWGTQTNLWFYYTSQRPPLWIIPAWPISTLATDRLARLLGWTEKLIDHRPFDRRQRCFRVAYWVVFTGFYALLVWFVAPSLDKSLTWVALILCALFILTPVDFRWATLIFVAGSALGYFLERWGTTRQCWTYYTHQTPPLFAVLAHGMACVAFWRTRTACHWAAIKLTRPINNVADSQ